MDQQDFDHIDVYRDESGIWISERNPGRDHHMPTNWRGGFSPRQAISIAARLLAVATEALPPE